MTKNTVTGKPSAVTGRPTDFSKIDIRDDMMFCSVFHNPEDCREFLQRIMGIRIAELRIVQEQKSMQSRYQGKGVRLDIYVRDVEGNSYDIEMQMINTGELPLRSRYYHSQMDIYQIQSGQTYMELQKSMVILSADLTCSDRAKAFILLKRSAGEKRTLFFRTKEKPCL